MTTELQSGQSVVFIGDSITDARRREDAGPLGAGYVKFVADLLAIREPQKRIVIHNRGINGDRVRTGLAHIPRSGLMNRWDRDVLQLRPDWLSIMIGVNDITSNVTEGVESVTPDAYERDLDGLLADTRRALPGCRLILCESFLVMRGAPADPRQQQIAELLPPFLAALHRLAEKHGTRLVRTHQRFQDVIAHTGTAPFLGDFIHPTPTGHLLIAEAVYDAFRPIPRP